MSDDSYNKGFARRAWTPEEDAIVIENQGTAAEIAQRIQRTGAAVKTRRRHLAGKLPLWGGDPLRWPRFAPLSRLVAKTCKTCGELRQAADFYTQHRGSSYAGECTRCFTGVVREYEHKAQISSLPQAKNYGKEWTGPEVEIVAREATSVSQAAQILGRSYFGAKSARLRALGALHEPTA
jgi:hypothetical protein